MELLLYVVVGVQVVFLLAGIIYFSISIKNQTASKSNLNQESEREMEKLRQLRGIHLAEPLPEKTRPKKLTDIVGQKDGIRALKAALCTDSPQHVLIYGPPGVGKTAAARLVLEEAKQYAGTTFSRQAKMIELDANTLHFDERSIADPLIGSVHDPIYQGAGAYGAAGVPQIKPGAVTKAHGGILFLDEIGELHPAQMNKLLKVLEDRTVYLTSAYYSETDKSIPKHVHSIFKNGLPADFRLIGATTRSPEEIPEAFRSRCTEIYFRALKKEEVEAIARNAFNSESICYAGTIPASIAKYAVNGRDTVKMVQTAAAIIKMEGRDCVTEDDLEWIASFSRCVPKGTKRIHARKELGVVNGLAVYGKHQDQGAILEIEAAAQENPRQEGTLTVMGIVEEEEIKAAHSKLRRTGSAKNSILTAMHVIMRKHGLQAKDYDITVNFPGGMPVDGPSAGAAVYAALYSALFQKEADLGVAMTGEITLSGKIRSVGGISGKIEAAIEAGVTKILIPKDNMLNVISDYREKIVFYSTVEELIALVFDEKVAEPQQNDEAPSQAADLEPLSAKA